MSGSPQPMPDAIPWRPSLDLFVLSSNPSDVRPPDLCERFEEVAMSVYRTMGSLIVTKAS